MLTLVALGAATEPTAQAQSVAAPAAAASAAIDTAEQRADRATDVMPDPKRPDLDLKFPAFEILAFQFGLNRVNRYTGTDHDDYKVTFSSIAHNLHSGWTTDDDPFETNQLGHPAQGAMYYGFARSTGFNYYQSLGYSFAGSAVWEIAGENTPPSRNDQVASGIGGSFLGEILYRMHSLVLEQGAGLSPFWREAAATAVDPAAGFNHIFFPEHYGSVYSSRGAAYYSTLQFGATHASDNDIGASGAKIKTNSAQINFALDYGLPGSSGYQYTRPFDYFNFQATLSSANAIESVFTRGLIAGATYEAGPDYRGVWGIYGSYDYAAPETFRVSSTALSLGTTAQWWIGQNLSMQGTGMAGVGYAAVGTTNPVAQTPSDPDANASASTARDYDYGLAPQALLNLRLVYADTWALGVTARDYFVSDIASNNSGNGHDNILRADAQLTWRFAKQQALSLRVIGNRRDATFNSPSIGRQSQVTVGLFYSLLGKDRFGTVDWR